MAGTRVLIVNADDFGQSPGINRGIIAAYERGIVTSTSLMVRWPAAGPAVRYARAHPDLSLGLHIDLCEWAFREGAWVPLYQVVPIEEVAAVTDEVNRQLDAFRALAGRNPTHLDSHQHVHLKEPVRGVLIAIAGTLGLPLRHFSPAIRYCGNFFGQTRHGLSIPGAISVESLIENLRQLPPGITELACHPGLDDDLDSMYRGQRREEVKVLIDPSVRAALVAEAIELRSFRDLEEST